MDNDPRSLHDYKPKQRDTNLRKRSSRGTDGVGDKRESEGKRVTKMHCVGGGTKGGREGD